MRDASYLPAGSRARRAERRPGFAVWLSVLIVVALSGACSEAFSPISGEFVRDEPLMASQANGPFRANAVKYRDSGARPATGRSGNAGAAVYALLDETGHTEVFVEAQNMNPLALATPMLTQVQIKGYGRDGRMRFVRNDNRSTGQQRASYRVGALQPGDEVQVQAHVSGAELWRIGVVTVRAYVLVAPNLIVESVTAPATAIVGVPVNITALVRETNGKLGARADCVLYVDGVEVDRANNIWVDAGDAVSCAFAHQFASTGSHSLEVRLVNPVPRMFHAETGSASTTINVSTLGSAPAFAWEASFEDLTRESAVSRSSSARTVDGRQGAESEDNETLSARSQESMLEARLPHAVAFPVDELVVQQLTRGEAFVDLRFADLQPTASFASTALSMQCAEHWSEESAGELWVYLCSGSSGGEEFTTLTYTAYAGEVTYRSVNHRRIWNEDDGQNDVYTDNNGWDSAVGTIVRIDGQVAFRVRLEKDGAVHAFEPVVHVSPFDDTQDVPFTCGEATSDGWIVRSCFGSTDRWHGVRGSAVN